MAAVAERDVLDLLHVVSQRRRTGQGQGDLAGDRVRDRGHVHTGDLAVVQRVARLSIGQDYRGASQLGAVRVGDLDVGISNRHATAAFGERSPVVVAGGATGIVGIQVDNRWRIVIDDRRFDFAVGGADSQVLEVTAGSARDTDLELLRRLGQLVVDGLDIERRAALAGRNLHGVHAVEV